MFVVFSLIFFLLIYLLSNFLTLKSIALPSCYTCGFLFPCLYRPTCGNHRSFEVTLRYIEITISGNCCCGCLNIVILNETLA